MSEPMRSVGGLIRITLPTIQYGGYFLLTSLINKNSGYMANPQRQNFFRAGYAHADVGDISPHSPELLYHRQPGLRRKTPVPCFEPFHRDTHNQRLLVGPSAD